ncbi:hypothetical protein H072_156 [Dactylellina haptotyla CBS 200.50]|uniref:CFEM domain-containing protein n=1 Tax=Dactylellina haptotyla (strain CBS 200.50) TaxID=1284197 RepID=S8AXT2_DACHA|nr:hypothetical protein H072_156 [Dactylellina haptotyla CBS 200.50]
MKSWILAIWVGWNFGVTVAQLDALPQCALSCALSSLSGTNCNGTDFACICNASSFIDSLVPCTRNACSASEFDQTVAAAQGLCSSAGVDLRLPTTIGGPTGITTLILSDPTLPSPTSIFTSNIPAVDVPTVPSGISGFSSRDTSQTSSPRTQTTSTRSSTSIRTSTTSSTSFGTSTTSTRSSSTPSASTSPQPATGSKLGSGAIAGIAVGVGVPLLAICLFVGFRMGRQKPDVPVVPINNDPEAREWGGIGPDKAR